MSLLAESQGIRVERHDAGSRLSNSFLETVEDRFGVLPNFFRSAPAAPGLIEELWKFACSAYLDNPLPSLFKERLFVYLSQFCPVRYCIVRHVGFLIGAGRPAGDASAQCNTIEQVISLLQRPRTDLASLKRALSQLLERTAPSAMPDADTELEHSLFDALTILFLTPLAGPRAAEAVRSAVGDMNFEYLAAFLAFVRTAHYWTETHPDIEIEADMNAVMARNEQLASLLLHTPSSVAP